MSILQVDAPKHQTRLKVVLLSLPARTQAVLDFFFTSTGRGSFAPVAEDQAEAAIFDLDTLESRQHWLSYRDRTGRPGIALSVQPQETEGAVWVRKPVTPAALLAAAADVHAGRWMRQAPPPEQAADVPVEAPAAHPEPLGAAPGLGVEAQSPSAEAAPHFEGDPTEAAQARLSDAMAALPEVVAPAAWLAEPVPAPPAPAPEVAPVPVAATLAAEPVPGVVVVGPAPVVALREEPAPMPTPPARTSPVVPAAAKPGRPGGLGGLIRRLFGAADKAAPQGATPAASPPWVAALVPSSSPADSASAPAPDRAQVTADLTPALPVVAEAPADPMVAVIAEPEVAVTLAETEPERIVDEPAPAAVLADQPEAAQVPEPEPAAPAAVAPPAASDARSRLLGGGATLAQANEALLCGDRADVPVDRLSEDPELRYDPDVHLVSALREAYLVGAKWQVPTHLECAAGRIVVDATRNLVLCDFEPQQLESLYATPLGKRPKTRTLNRQEQAEVQERPRDDAGTRRLDELLWRAGLLTGSGRLPIDADPQRPIYLRQWPNLTRISAIPNAVRIAALWSARGASLAETTQLLNIPQRHVIAFYNGALALDLITEDGSHIHRAQRKAGRNRGLLSRLLGWLR